jgi:feruloyl esterase
MGFNSDGFGRAFMSVCRIAGVCVLFAFLAPVHTRIDARTACDQLTLLPLPHATVTSATEVAAGAFTPPTAGGRGIAPALAKTMAALQPFCRVAITSTPTTDSDIKIEVWLPTRSWNGKLQAVGNGGWAGTISYSAMAAAMTQAYATVSTDTGHMTPGASFAVGHPEKLADYAHRSLHEMAINAKVIVDAFYGKPATASVWNGCSTGGNQGLTLASMYPDDFDAIIAGASPDPRARLHGVRLLAHGIVHRTPDSYIPPEKYSVIHNAVMDACDAKDGVKDGVLENPPACRFDPQVLACKGADSPSCLTSEQVATARALVSEVKHPQTGNVLYPPLLQQGSELNWATLAGPQPFGNAAEAYKFLVASDPSWDPTTFRPESDIELTDTKVAVLNTVTPNLKPFFARGGKLLMFHGWNDQQVPAMSSVTYYTRVLDAVGKNAAAKSIQLYMVPGMNHCQGGIGTDTFDKIGAMEEWMARGTAPAAIVASHATDGKVDRTRPLCPYPQVAVYKGSGSTDDAASFACRSPK